MITEALDPISRDVLNTGQKISMDHFTVTEKGRLYDSYGNSSLEEMYTGGCIFYDHATSWLTAKFQINFTSSKNIEAKTRFERELLVYGILVHQYHTDNGIFSTKEHTKQIYKDLQSVEFSGVGANHQN